MKRRSVIFSPEAQGDLEWIYDTVATASSPTIALGFMERIERHCRSLDIGSERGTRRDEIRPGLRVVGFERRVSIAFSVEAEEVLILRVFYGGADWSESL